MPSISSEATLEENVRTLGRILHGTRRFKTHMCCFIHRNSLPCAQCSLVCFCDDVGDRTPPRITAPIATGIARIRFVIRPLCKLVQGYCCKGGASRVDYINQGTVLMPSTLTRVKTCLLSLVHLAHSGMIYSASFFMSAGFVGHFE